MNLANDKEGIITPLMDACHAGFTPLIEPLLKAGADVSIRDKNGWSCGDYLAEAILQEKRQCRGDESEQVIEAKRILRLIKQMEKPTSVVRQRVGVLHSAITNQDEDADELLLIEEDLPPRPRANKLKLPKKRLREPTSPRPRNSLSPPDGGQVKAFSRPKENFAPNVKDDLTRVKSNWPQMKKRRVQQDVDDILKREQVQCSSVSSSLNAAKAPPEKKEVVASVEKPVTLITPRESSTWSVIVKIAERPLRVIVDRDATVEDLAKDSARRYFESYDRQPVLKLFDQEGAELHPKDKLLSIVSTCQTRVSFTTEVISWLETPLDEAYQYFCQKMNVLSLTEVKQRLANAKTDGILDLKRQGLGYPMVDLSPIFKALETGRAGLREVRLSQCKLGLSSHLWNLLLTSLPGLRSISHLDLSNNALSWRSVSELSSGLAPLSHLSDLDLSFNPLTNKAIASLEKMTNEQTTLSRISLKSCCLTADFLSASSDFLVQWTEIDLSFNRLGSRGLRQIFHQLLRSNAIEKLIVEGCVRTSSPENDDFLIEKFAELLESAQNHLTYVGFRHNRVNTSRINSSLRSIIMT